MTVENDPRWDRCAVSTCGHWRADHDHWAVSLSGGTIEHACDSCEVTVSEHEFVPATPKPQGANE